MKELTAETLRDLVSYDSATGEFRWRIRRSQSVRAGDRVGYPVASTGGYWMTEICGKAYLLHRLAWLYISGNWPKDQIDHINGVRTDNRLANLREATHAGNCRNSKTRSDNRSGFRGVSWHPRTRKWQARICSNGGDIYLGIFDTPEAASAAYEAKATELFGEFKRTLTT
jgi:hypothetical protein